MIYIDDVKDVYVASAPIDFRKSINGLIILVSSVFNIEEFENTLFVFTNKQKNKCKILHYSVNGFWMYYKRLDSEKFKWPEGDNFKITLSQLKDLMNGHYIKTQEIAFDQKKYEKKYMF